MQVLIYTKDDNEYLELKKVITGISEANEVYRDPSDGHGHYSGTYDIVVVALDGAKGLNEVTEWADRTKTRIVWITDDKEFAGVAIRKHVSDFIIRPYTEERIKESVTGIIKDCGFDNIWHITAI